MKIMICILILIMVCLSGPATAQESDPDQQDGKVENAPIDVIMPDTPVKAWGFAFRVGSFSSSNDAPGWIHSVRGQASFELSHYFSDRSAMCFNVDGLAFESQNFGIVPITAAYKFFPLGNGPGEGRPFILPWIGGGGGIYRRETSIWRFDDSRSVIPGVHVTGGASIPIGSVFDLNGELRYAVTEDFRLTSVLVGFGLRF